LYFAGPHLTVTSETDMRHITISGHHVGGHKVAGMFWIVASSQCAKAANRVLRDHRAQANHEHCQSVSSSAAPDAGNFLDIWLRTGTKEFGGLTKASPLLNADWAANHQKAWTASANTASQRSGRETKPAERSN
jgi:hypothetical protein